MKLIRKNIYKITLIIVLIIVVSILLLKYNLKNNEVYASTEDNSIVKIEPNKKENLEVLPVYVDIKGEINNPGVYEVMSNDRVIDIINKAGGLRENANTSLINLSKKVMDEMVIIIYSNAEIEAKLNDTNNIIYECDCPDQINDACLQKESNIETEATNVIININTANKEALTTLSNIGESKAISIIEYREKNGPFKLIEDIMNVSGIGNSIYEKIKDNITT